ncbi:MAG: hypothetical protein ACE5H8_02210 [Alphaproteobacteria bacterium]
MATKLQDAFTDANGTSLDLHTMDVGAGWLEHNGDFDIQGNEANAVIQELHVATADAGVADCTLDVDVKHPASADQQTNGFVFRFSDTNNLWLLVLNPFDTVDELQLYDKQAGTFTLRASASFVHTTGVFYALQAVLSGNSITGTVNGGSTVSFTSAFNATATRHGIRGNATAGVRWDNFLCTTGGATVLGAAALAGAGGLTPAGVSSAAGAASANAAATLASSAVRTASCAAAPAGSATMVPAAARISAGLLALAASATLGVRLDAFATPAGAVFLVPVETRRFVVAAENGTFAVPVEDRTFRVN